MNNGSLLLADLWNSKGVSIDGLVQLIFSGTITLRLTPCYSFPLNSKIFKPSDASGASKNLVT